MTDIRQTIKKALSGSLPGKDSHLKMLPANRSLTADMREHEQAKDSSVLLLLFIDNGELMALLIKRPAHMKHHAGQIALPGGRIEKGENPEKTALRETWEEIGIIENEIEIIGQLSPLYVQVSKFRIQPFVGWLKNRPDCKVNKNEVEKTVFFPVKNMSGKIEEVFIETQYGRLSVPCIRYEDEMIWGATAMILLEFSDTVSRVI